MLTFARTSQGTEQTEKPSSSPLFLSNIQQYLTKDPEILQATYLGKTQNASFLPPPSGEESLHYCGDIVSGIGPSYYQNLLSWQAAMRLTPDELHDYRGWDVIGARFFLWADTTHVGEVRFYDQNTSTRPGTMIASEPYNVSGQGWKRVDLSHPFPLNVTRDLWTSILINKIGDVDYSMGIDAGPHVPGKGDFCNFGSSWQSLYTASQGAMDANWGIEAIIYKFAEVTGPEYGKVKAGYDFSLGQIETPGHDVVYCELDWGDGLPSGWIGPFDSGTFVNVSHAWSEPGEYEVKARLKNADGFESSWTDPTSITIIPRSLLIVQFQTKATDGLTTTLNETAGLILHARPWEVQRCSSNTIIILFDEKSPNIHAHWAIGWFYCLIIP